MTQLVLLVVAAAWAAVLLPPMLRSRVDNRPNSSVTDFRRQLNKLQSTATPPRGAIRGLGRPLAPPVGRPGSSIRTPQAQPVLRSGVTMPRPAREAEPVGGPVTIDPMRRDERRDPTRRHRSHGDPSGGMRRHGDPSAGMRPSVAVDERVDDWDELGEQRPRRDVSGPMRRHGDHTGGARRHGDPTGGMQRPSAADDRSMAKRRRSNVLFVMLVATACTLFLAATTGSTVMVYLFALSFLALCGYVYLLAQLRQRDETQYAGWLDTY